MAELQAQYGIPQNPDPNKPGPPTDQAVDYAKNAPLPPGSENVAQSGVGIDNRHSEQPATGGRRFRVLHNGYGPFPGPSAEHPQGHVFTEEEFKALHPAPPNVDPKVYHDREINRALSLNAIMRVPDDTPTTPTPIGPLYGGFPGPAPRAQTIFAKPPYDNPSAMAGDGRPSTHDAQRENRELVEETVMQRTRASRGAPAEKTPEK